MIKRGTVLVLLLVLVACGTTPTTIVPTAPPPIIGNEVVVGTTAWTVHAVATPGSSYTGNGRTATTGGSYVVIDLSVTNRSDQERKLEGSATKLFTAAHDPAEPSTEKDILLANPAQCLDRKLGAHEMTRCTFIYQVLPGAIPSQLEVTELGSSSSSTLIDLTKGT